MSTVTKRHMETIRWWTWGLTVMVMVCVLILISLPPWVGEPWRLMIMHAFDPFCHQIAERSPHINGVQVAVCHRCYGIYLGLLLGPFLLFATRRWRGSGSAFLVVLSLTPMSVDWVLDVIGLIVNTPASRMITGAVFGLFASLLVVRALALRSVQVSRTIMVEHAEVPVEVESLARYEGLRSEEEASQCRG